MVKKVTLEQVLAAWQAIARIAAEPVSVKFAFGVTKNKGKIKNDYDGIVAAEKERFELDRERVKYCEEHAEKDAAGKPVLETDQTGRKRYKGISDDDPGLKEIVERMKKSAETFEAFLKTETEIDFHEIAFSDVPEKIAQADFESLSIMIGEPKEDKK